uniref:Transposable element Tc3 transposase n=1 Tax=Heterorhabditis bacteriophora TaxID=37862 RepID=A0A1I7X375_HETBA
MGRASTLSLHERGQIKALSTAGYTVKQIADVIKRSRKAIMNFLRHQEEYGTKKSSGRPSKLNDREKREFCGLRRIARSASMNPYGFYESSKISLLINYLEFRDLRKEPRHFSTRNFGGGSVLVWGAFSRMGLMNSSNYQEVLGHRLVPYVQRFPGVSLTFQQDNATIHTWLQDNSVDTVDWPSRSPDLNPIENLWAILVRRIYADNRQFETVKDLQNAISKAWNEIDEDVIKNLVINRNGSCTDY